MNDPIFLGDANVSASAVFVETAGGERFIFGGDFKNESRRNVDWKTAASLMSFVSVIDLGSSGVFNTQLAHDLYLPGRDVGANAAGFNDNFAWATLSLASGNSLALCDGNTTTPGGALYVRRLVLAEGLGQISRITGHGLRIYYLAGLPENAYLGG